MEDRSLGRTAPGSDRPSATVAPFALRPETRHWLLGLARAAVGAAAEAYRDGRLDELEARLAGYGPPGRAATIDVEQGAAGPGRIDPAVVAELETPAAAFVTLTIDGELRGCMGRLDAGRPVWENVRDAAIAAAIGDPRFPPLEPEEVPGVRIEVSVLGPMIEIADPSIFDAARHGIVVEAAGRRALLLPKVAKEQGWDEATTLAAVCRKAGLPPEAWRWPETRCWIFEAEDFGEAEWAVGPGTGAPIEGTGSPVEGAAAADRATVGPVEGTGAAGEGTAAVGTRRAPISIEPAAER